MLDLRDFMEKLGSKGELLTIEKEINWSLNAAALAAMSNRTGAQAIHFKKLKGYSADYTLAANLLSGPGTFYPHQRNLWGRFASAIGVKPEVGYYEHYLEPGSEVLPENTEIELELRNPKTLAAFRVKAIVNADSNKLPGGDVLWLFSTKGRQQQPWAIKIIEEIEEEEPEATVLPRRKLSLGERKGRMLADMIKEREEKKKEK